jgi:predicted alpha-1,2-mannosidase
LGVALLVVVAASTSFLIASRDSGDASSNEDLTRYVDPFTGTASGAQGIDVTPGNTFPGPVLPGGMIRLGPETAPSANVSGYAYDDNQIRGFSLKRMSGAGCRYYRDVPITPTTSPIAASPVEDKPRGDLRAEYVSSFSHDREEASPGYYRVTLQQAAGDTIDTELTTSLRAAVARFTFPRSADASLIFNPAAKGGSRPNSDVHIEIDPARREVSGSTTGGGFCFPARDGYTLHFAMRFDQPFRAYGTWQGQQLSIGATSGSDDETGAYVSFDASNEQTIEMRVAVSFVSVEGARVNLDSELAGKSFSDVRSDARREWNSVLRTIEVNGGSDAELERFYTALYQSQIEPAVFSDADGRYPGMEDGQIHVAEGYAQYADFSGWDVYRTQLPLMAIVRREAAADVAQSLVADARQSGWLPKWSVANSHTWIMTGDPAAPAIASIYAFGATSFDAPAALAAMVKGATEVGQSPSGYVERQALQEYIRLGYVPYERNSKRGSYGWPALVPPRDNAAVANPWGSAATTLEYAIADLSIAQMARVLGDLDTCRAFVGRGGAWEKLFNPATGYLEPRWSDGSFVTNGNPGSDDGFAEGTVAQYTWMVPHDIAGLVVAMGGADVAARRLDDFFTRLNDGMESTYANLGNEVNANAPWIYNWLGQPHKTQALVRRVLDELYPNGPGGLPGNDDLGQMSAWYVFAAIGLYPAIPGTDVLAIGAPQFPEITLHLAHADVRIAAPDTSDTRPYISALRVNGETTSRAWVGYAELAMGATLEFSMFHEPSAAWGTAPADAPPSFAPNDQTVCAVS